jgi:hypothetical protein
MVNITFVHNTSIRRIFALRYVYRQDRYAGVADLLFERILNPILTQSHSARGNGQAPGIEDLPSIQTKR